MTQSSPARPVAIVASSAPPRTKPSTYPEPFFSRMAKREKRPLGDFFGLTNFGVNLTRLAPGGKSALLHRHSKKDEFIYVLEGEPTLVTDHEEVRLSPGMCAGFRAQGIAHHLVNSTDRDVVAARRSSSRLAKAAMVRPSMAGPALVVSDVSPGFGQVGRSIDLVDQ